MTPKQFKRLLERDQHRCLHCGETEALAPNHRVNRGMGGSKLRDQPSNYVLICSLLNGQIESDSKAAEMAKRYGWKLSSWENPAEIPVYDTLSGNWFLLDDEFSRKIVSRKER